MPNKKILAALIAAVALTACGSAPQQPSEAPAEPAPASPAATPGVATPATADAPSAPEVAPAPALTASVSGKLSYRTRQVLPPDAVIRVQLLEVGAAEPKLIGEQVFEPKGNQVPTAFKVSYDPTAIVAKNRYRLSARIEAGGSPLMVSEGSNGVITLGYPKSRNLVLKPVKAK